MLRADRLVSIIIDKLSLQVPDVPPELVLTGTLIPNASDLPTCITEMDPDNPVRPSLPIRRFEPDHDDELPEPDDQNQPASNPDVLGPNVFHEQVENGLIAVRLFNRLKSEDDIASLGTYHVPNQWEGSRALIYDDIREFETAFEDISYYTRDFLLLSNRVGKTLLHVAAEKGCLRVARFLLDRARTLDINLLAVLSRDGKTPRELAIENIVRTNFTDMAELLIP